MAIERFVIGNEDADRARGLAGVTVELEIRPQPNLPAPEKETLRQWALDRAEDVVQGHLNHNQLLAESIHIRMLSEEGEVIVDTITDRNWKKPSSQM